MDNINNMLVKIRNANKANLPTVSLPYSNLTFAVVSALAKSGYVGAPSRKGKRMKFIELPLLYENDQPKISSIKRLSKQSKRMYAAHASIRPVRNGFGKVVLSTSKGVMTGEEAKKEKVGGEVLFEIW